MANIKGSTNFTIDYQWFKDDIIRPNEITPIFWAPIPAHGVFSMPQLNIDMIATGQSDFSASETIRQRIPGAANGTNNFVKQGFVDIQGWLISNSVPLTEDFDDSSAKDIVDDWIRKVRVPRLDSGFLADLSGVPQSGSLEGFDQRLQTIEEGTGAENNEVAVAGENTFEDENDVSEPDNGLATKHPAVLDMVSWYDLGARMFYEERIYLGTRHMNAIPVGEESQRYWAAVRTNIAAKGSKGEYGIVIFTASMPHLNAFGTPGDDADDRIAPWSDWAEMQAMYDRYPLEWTEMKDEVSIAAANAVIRGEMDNAASSDYITQKYGISEGFKKIVEQKRLYSVKPGVWEQKPLLYTIRCNYNITYPFTFIPNRG